MEQDKSTYLIFVILISIGFFLSSCSTNSMIERMPITKDNIIQDDGNGYYDKKNDIFRTGNPIDKKMNTLNDIDRTTKFIDPIITKNNKIKNRETYSNFDISKVRKKLPISNNRSIHNAKITKQIDNLCIPIIRKLKIVKYKTSIILLKKKLKECKQRQAVMYRTRIVK